MSKRILQAAVTATLIAIAATACTVGDPISPGELTCNTEQAFSDCDAVNYHGDGVPGYCSREKAGYCAPVCQEAIGCVNWTVATLGKGTPDDPMVAICYCNDEDPNFWSGQ